MSSTQTFSAQATVSSPPCYILVTPKLNSNSPPAKSIDDSPGSSWKSSNAISSVYVPAYGSYRVYYTNPAIKNIVSYFENATSPWRGNQDANWGKPQGSIASVSWLDQVRLWYFDDDALVMSAQNASTWGATRDV